MIKKTIMATLVASALALYGCSGSDNNNNNNNQTPTNPSSGSSEVTFDATPVIEQTGRNIILKGYKDLDAAGADLKAKLDALAGEATEEEMQAAQDSWKAARVVWESGEGHIFGPIESLRTDPFLDSWPLSTNDLQTFLDDIDNITPDKVRNFGTDVQGFHAIEYLLFGDGVNDNDKAASELTNAEALYLTSLGAVFKERTEELLNAWEKQYDPEDDSTGPYINEFVSPGAGKRYVSQGAVMEELINGMIGIIDEVGNGKIADPLGDSAAAADTSKVESQYSWNSLTDFHNNIQSVRKLYTGIETSDGNDAGTQGVHAFVAKHDANLAKDVLDQINDAMNKIALVDGDSDPSTTDITTAGQVPFRNAISDANGRTRIQAAVDALSALQTALEEKILPLIAKTKFGS